LRRFPDRDGGLERVGSASNFAFEFAAEELVLFAVVAPLFGALDEQLIKPSVKQETANSLKSSFIYTCHLRRRIWNKLIRARRFSINRRGAIDFACIIRYRFVFGKSRTPLTLQHDEFSITLQRRKRNNYLKLFSAPSLNPTPNQRLTRECLIFLAFFGLTILMTWPWALHLRDAVSDPGDPYLNAWIMWWDYHQTFHDPLNLFRPTSFILTAIRSPSVSITTASRCRFSALRARSATADDSRIGDTARLRFSGYGAFRLARTLDGSTAAAWITGIAFAFVPYRFAHLSHLNYLFAG
jgi:hypothetical protein